MRVRRGGVVLVIAMLLVSACSDTAKPATSGSSGASSGASNQAAIASTTQPACDRPHPAGQTAETFDFQGTPRTYQLYVPKGYDGQRPVPVVFNFHGYGSNAVEQMAYGNFHPEADQDTFLIVAPDGQDSPGGRHFNLTGEPGKQDDIAMVRSLLDLLESQLCVDTRRVYSTGMSDGGAMTSVLACTASDRFAAFAAVAVVIHAPGCAATRHLAFAGFSGTADPIIPFEGGATRCCGGVVLAAPSDAMANWAAFDGCAPEYSEKPIGTDVRERTWPRCLDGSEVDFYIVDGGGHTWPGSIPVSRLGKTTDQLDASSTIWGFFKAHPLPQ